MPYVVNITRRVINLRRLRCEERKTHKAYCCAWFDYCIYCLN